MASPPYPLLRNKAGAPAVSPLTVTTPRLLLTQISQTYAPQIFQEYTIELTTYMGVIPTSHPDGTGKFIDISLKQWDESIGFTFTIFSAPSSEFLGICSIHAREADEPGPKGDPEMGVWV